MINDSVSVGDLPNVTGDELQAQVRAVIPVGEPSEPPAPSRRRPARPRQVAADHLWVGLLWAVLEGLSGYHALARLLATRVLGCFVPVSVTGSAVLLRLQQAGLAPLQDLFASLGAWLAAAVPAPAWELAPFASHILALDETKLDALVRRWPCQRQHRLGDPALLAGKLVALFDIRAQRWLRLQYVSDALPNLQTGRAGHLSRGPLAQLAALRSGLFQFPAL